MDGLFLVIIDNVRLQTIGLVLRKIKILLVGGYRGKCVIRILIFYGILIITLSHYKT